MKCEHCGKNEVTFLYQSNINGAVTEKHLCGECARKLGYDQALRRSENAMMQRFFGEENTWFRDVFSPMPQGLGGRRWLLEDPFEDFFAEMPALRSGQEQREPPREERKNDLVDQAEQSRFSRLRQANALRHEMKAAVRQEDFERAAQLRDQLRAMETEQ